MIPDHRIDVLIKIDSLQRTLEGLFLKKRVLQKEMVMKNPFGALISKSVHIHTHTHQKHVYIKREVDRRCM